MRDAVVGDRALERRRHVRLHRDGRERLGAVFPGEGERHQAVGHARAQGPGEMKSAGLSLPLRSGNAFRPRNTPGLTKQRKTPHAAATCGVLTGLVGSRPPGPGASSKLPPRLVPVQPFPSAAVRNSRQSAWSCCNRRMRRNSYTCPPRPPGRRPGPRNTPTGHDRERRPVCRCRARPGLKWRM